MKLKSQLNLSREYVLKLGFLVRSVERAADENYADASSATC